MFVLWRYAVFRLLSTFIQELAKHLQTVVTALVPFARHETAEGKQVTLHHCIELHT